LNPTQGMDGYTVCVFSVCVVFCVGEVLRLADPPSKEFYILCIEDQGTEKVAKAQKRAVEP
jgi:hypothetical protein